MTPETIPVDKALWERCEAFVRQAQMYLPFGSVLGDQARAIVAQLPPSVDRLLLRAREICRDHAVLPDQKQEIMDGNWDEQPFVRAVLKALREGEG
jgi:hypothetical protein